MWCALKESENKWQQHRIDDKKEQISDVTKKKSLFLHIGNAFASFVNELSALEMCKRIRFHFVRFNLKEREKAESKKKRCEEEEWILFLNTKKKKYIKTQVFAFLARFYDANHYYYYN